ncbi:hypothetical protein [Rickettsiella endosymbiont of Dermanyssus gallinae]|nr:hypothetical protein [Rickettsiella endosymbiont of Dermanyssus gallinae]
MSKIPKVIVIAMPPHDSLFCLKQALECEAYKRRVYSVPILSGWKETLND